MSKNRNDKLKLKKTYLY